MALRRERLAGDDKDRSRDKPPYDPAHDDRRWNGADTDGRQKRGAARDRRSGADEPRERDDRRDREREKEPAWMDSNEAPSAGLGILGGRAADGALDGIQAWKKGMKEKEEREKAQQQAKSDSTPAQAAATPGPSPAVDASGKPLDEIQLFKMLMKREEGKKSDAPGSEQAAGLSPQPPSGPHLHISSSFAMLTLSNRPSHLFLAEAKHTAAGSRSNDKGHYPIEYRSAI